MWRYAKTVLPRCENNTGWRSVSLTSWHFLREKIPKLSSYVFVCLHMRESKLGCEHMSALISKKWHAVNWNEVIAHLEFHGLIDGAEKYTQQDEAVRWSVSARYSVCSRRDSIIFLDMLVLDVNQFCNTANRIGVKSQKFNPIRYTISTSVPISHEIKLDGPFIIIVKICSQISDLPWDGQLIIQITSLIRETPTVRLFSCLSM